MADVGEAPETLEVENGDDVEMAGAAVGIAEGEENALPGDITDDPPQRPSFLEYVSSIPKVAK